MVGNKRCILIADDERKMVYALKDFFKANRFYVIEAYDGDDAVEKYWENSTEIDLVLLDVMMPGKDGFEVLRELRENASLVPVIMLTARGAEYDQINGLNSGADDYIQKPFSPTVLLARVEAVLRRFGKAGENEIVAGDITINAVRRSVYVKGEEIELTRREYDLLMFFLNNQSITFTRDQILNNVWGYDFEGGERTVDTHIKQLRIKLKSTADYIRTIHCVGYRFEAI
ncbi:MAG: response regulator transcription factor [Clostridiales bacterium]|nr:response regulator transcription factor [Clostridiales bacterium]